MSSDGSRCEKLKMKIKIHTAARPVQIRRQGQISSRNKSLDGLCQRSRECQFADRLFPPIDIGGYAYDFTADGVEFRRGGLMPVEQNFTRRFHFFSSNNFRSARLA